MFVDPTRKTAVYHFSIISNDNNDCFALSLYNRNVLFIGFMQMLCRRVRCNILFYIKTGVYTDTFYTPLNVHYCCSRHRDFQ